MEEPRRLPDSAHRPLRASRKLGGSAHILEANMAQTVGSSSSSVASGVIFTIPPLS